ncbi:putative glycosyl transferase, group 2 family protein [Megalodesulfovibrio gigas]|uniref:Putative glycosyl transferase, group 2 family protein n=1 Tax=Megalodesulfovibrio gigas (strain ATCC 19364 / DSM 1382 / NCIMB 9332 / VKM B-1759) TaxID=1121448 RepID=T2GBI5_MEGG1|nr:putative glycosyl transferase, group 2 family protein [Megalodesulfovibrio gigas]AGW13950.1 putative glycosyl transferase, group 2 family protein [Megalodesulfovibrio gigas DSM 1382 = ATCC 19364]
MTSRSDVRISVITPSRGDRPRALAQAGQSLDAAVAHAVAAGLLDPHQVQWLVGFDGVKGQRPEVHTPARFIDFPRSGNFGNRIRNSLLRLAAGSHLMFLDDDNALTPQALACVLPHLETDMIIGRIDVRRAFDIPLLPRPGPVEEVVRQGNIDPLCLCLSRDLVKVRGRGWNEEGGYESDLRNIRRYYHRAASVLLLDEVIGIYDAGRGLDPDGMNQRQRDRQEQS